MFAKLRALRKTLADREGVPAYALFTNEQLADMVRRRITTGEAMAPEGATPGGKGLDRDQSERLRGDVLRVPHSEGGSPTDGSAAASLRGRAARVGDGLRGGPHRWSRIAGGLRRGVGARVARRLCGVAAGTTATLSGALL